LTERFDIAGYTRISVDDELDRDNVSIENQKAIIEDYVHQRFPGSSLTFYEDRDRSGYTFGQREGYQAMRRGLLSHKYDILVVKDSPAFRGATAGVWWSWKTFGTLVPASSPSGTASTFPMMTTG
jgi:hypothetical protein